MFSNMGSLKALQEWCRIQCENYNHVDVKNMSTSFRDGLAFCAIIHRYRPDLIDFDSLSKENVYENNRLAFETAESELGIPALLDPEDMVSMKVPDRLSIITYVSQYYNFFTNKSHANPPCMKRPSGIGHIEPAQKKPATPLEDKVVEPKLSLVGQDGEEGAGPKRGPLSSTCAACQGHVHLVQRFLVDGRLYHRNCFRCRECSSTLLPGSYKPGSEVGSLVCTHHFARPALAGQNGRPDLSKRPSAVSSVRIGRPAPPRSPPPGRDQEAEASQPPKGALLPKEATPQNEPLPPTEATPPNEPPSSKEAVPQGCINNDYATPANDSDSTPCLSHTTKANSLEEEKERDEPPPSDSAPPNPFDDSEEEAAEEGKGVETPVKDAANGVLPPTPVCRPGLVHNRPIPAPRRVSHPSPPPRPTPRARPPQVDNLAVNGDVAEHRRSLPVAPRPRERSNSPGSASHSSDVPKPPNPPWLALVQSQEPKKKPAPPPPGGTTPPNSGSLASLKAEGSPDTPPAVPANPFDDNDEEAGPGQGSVAGLVPPTGAVSHPWYSISQAADAAPGPDTPPAGGSSNRSASPGSSKGKKRPAPPKPVPKSPSSSSAISIESLSSASDHSSSHPASLGGGANVDQDNPVTKSVSEPSICGPCGEPAPSPSTSADRLSQGLSPPPPPANTSSAPATPQSIRSARPPPPRPPVTPSPLASSGAVPIPPPKRTCKENPFNRKASPSPVATPKSRPPRGPRPARPPAPGHGFPLIKRKVQSDQYIPVEDIHGEMADLEKQLNELEQRGVELERKLRDNPSGEEEETLLVDWFTLIHEKHLLVRREAELVYTAKQQNLEERQADVEYELRCILNKPEKDWSEEDKGREQELMKELVTVIEQRNQIINSMDQDRQREEEEDMLVATMIKKKDFQRESPAQGEQQPQKKKEKKFKPMKVLKRLSVNQGKSVSPRKESPEEGRS